MASEVTQPTRGKEFCKLFYFSFFNSTGTISPLSVTSDSSWEVAIYDPVIIAPIICTCFVVIVVFATIAYFTASSRRIQVETAAMDNCKLPFDLLAVGAIALLSPFLFSSIFSSSFLSLTLTFD